jgi:hypothetical protein
MPESSRALHARSVNAVRTPPVEVRDLPPFPRVAMEASA